MKKFAGCLRNSFVSTKKELPHSSIPNIKHYIQHQTTPLNKHFQLKLFTFNTKTLRNRLLDYLITVPTLTKNANKKQAFPAQRHARYLVCGVFFLIFFSLWSVLLTEHGTPRLSLEANRLRKPSLKTCVVVLSLTIVLVLYLEMAVFTQM